MTKQTAKQNDKPVAAKSDDVLRVANVARELNVNEKRARSFLRRPENVAAYNEFRNKTFTRNSSAYKKCVELLTTYKTKTAALTK